MNLIIQNSMDEQNRITAKSDSIVKNVKNRLGGKASRLVAVVLNILEQVEERVDNAVNSVTGGVSSLDTRVENLEYPVATSIGVIDFTTDLNDAYTTGVTEVDVVFAAKKPEGKFIVKAFFEADGDIVSYTGIEVTSIEVIEPFAMGSDGDIFPGRVAQDVTVRITLDAVNAADWLSGEIKVSAIFGNHPV